MKTREQIIEEYAKKLGINDLPWQYILNMLSELADRLSEQEVSEGEIVEWLLNNCSTTQRLKNGQYVFFWILNSEAADAWDGENDDKIKLYTSREVFKAAIKELNK